MNPITGSTYLSTCNSQSSLNKAQGKKASYEDFLAILAAFRQSIEPRITLNGEEDNDKQRVTGDNYIEANGWSPEIHTGTGDDRIQANGWSPYIQDEGGNNHIEANGWSPEILTGTGNDRIQANGWSPYIRDGGGNNDIEANGWSPDIHGGTGNDRIQANGWSPDIHGGGGHDVIETNGSFSDVRGEDGDDNIRASGNYSRVDGGSGNDTLRGSGSNLLLKGGAGQDEITAAGDAAQVYGGEGNDKITVKNSEPVTLHRITEIEGDIPDVTGSASGGVRSENPEFRTSSPAVFGRPLTTDVYGGTGHDTINLENAQANIHFNAGDGVDIIRGGTPDDTLVFGTGLSPENATYELTDNRLTIGFEGSDDKVILEGWRMETSPHMRFSDGTVVTGADVQNLIH